MRSLNPAQYTENRFPYPAIYGDVLLIGRSQNHGLERTCDGR